MSALLNQDVRSFMPNEPFNTFDHETPDEYFLQDSLRLLHDLVECDFTRLIGKCYVNTAGIKDHFITWSKDNPAFESFGNSSQKFFLPDTQHALCSNASRLIIKMTDVPVYLLPSMIGTFDERTQKRFKILNLIRDPRAVINSRLKKKGMRSFRMDPRRLCDTMDRDARGIQKLHSEHPDSYFGMRYEDMTLNLESMTRQLFERLGIPFSEREEKFLKTGTALDKERIRGFSRKEAESRTTAWLHEMSVEKIAEVEKACGELLDRLHYSRVNVTGPDGVLEPLIGSSADEPAFLSVK